MICPPLLGQPLPEIWKKSKPHPWVMFFSLCWFILYDMCNINAAKFEKRQTDQLKTFQKLSWNHVLECQNTSLLVQAMLCTAANTSPVERGYTILKIIASKRRNRITLENLEVLLLLGTLKIPVKIQKTMKMKENALKRRNEHLIRFYLVWGYIVS